MRQVNNNALDIEERINFDSPILAVDQNGFPKEKVEPEALDNSTRAFWSYHQKKIWAVLVAISLFFLWVLI